MGTGLSPRTQAGFLGACLVDSDSEFEKRARKIKRRALLASIVLQILVVAALVVFPLFSKGESISGSIYIPVPPYRHGSAAGHHQQSTRPAGHPRTVCIACFTSVPPIVSAHEPIPAADPIDEVDTAPPGSPEGPIIPGLSDNGVSHHPPPPPRIEPARPRTLKVSAGVQAARLVHRVDPTYPPLARQIRREGRVELRAIIATDGRVQSLEAVSGDPLLIQSALSAVREWRYQPTLLNNEPVEIETYITVIYTLSH